MENAGLHNTQTYISKVEEEERRPLVALAQRKPGTVSSNRNKKKERVEGGRGVERKEST